MTNDPAITPTAGPFETVFLVSLTCEAPALPGSSGPYKVTYGASTNDDFVPWPVFGESTPTSFTLIGSATAIQLPSGGIDPVPVQVSVVISGSGYSGDAGPSSAKPINLSASAAGNGRATAILQVNLADYGATPTNLFTVPFAHTAAVGTAPTLSQSRTVATGLQIIPPLA